MLLKSSKRTTSSKKGTGRVCSVEKKILDVKKNISGKIIDSDDQILMAKYKVKGENVMPQEQL